MRSGVLTGISSRQRSAIAAAHYLNDRTLETQSAVRQTHLRPCKPQYGLHITMFSGNHSLFWVAGTSVTRKLHQPCISDAFLSWYCRYDLTTVQLYNICNFMVFCALYDQLASVDRRVQLTRCFSAVAELLVYTAPAKTVTASLDA